MRIDYAWTVSYTHLDVYKRQTQDRVGEDGYDAGAKILTDFFRKEVAKFDTPDLDPRGKQIIDCFMNGGTLADYEAITPTNL